MSYSGEKSVFRKPLGDVEGEDMFIMRVEIDNVKNMYTRYTQSVWEIASLAGGFAVFAVFIFEFLYKFAKSNSVYVLQQAYLKS